MARPSGMCGTPPNEVPCYTDGDIAEIAAELAPKAAELAVLVAEEAVRAAEHAAATAARMSKESEIAALQAENFQANQNACPQ